MGKTFETTYAETGRQSELDALRKSGGFEEAKAKFEGGGRFALPSPTKTPSSPGQQLTLPGGKLYGGWYDNPASGRNQRFFGVDQSGKEIWTDGDEPGLPSDASEVTPYLNNFQNNVFGEAGAPEIRVPTMEELKAKLKPETELPALLDRKGAFEGYRAEFGVEELESSLNELKAQERDEDAFFRTQRFTEEGKPVPLGVIAGRVGEEERAAKERLDFIGRQKSRVIDELNTKYTLIGQYMEFEGLDYQDAVTRYQDEFNRNIQMYDIITGKEAAARSAFESDRAAASANLNIYMNALTAGNIDYGSLSGDQRLMINKLEAQAGMPIGTMSRVKVDPGSDIVFTSTNKGVTQVGIRNADGSIGVQSYGTPTGDGGGAGGGGGTVSERRATETRSRFSSDVTSINPISTDEGTVGIFPQLVSRYASELDLSEIYDLYNKSSVAQEFGRAGEDPKTMQDIYELYK